MVNAKKSGKSDTEEQILKAARKLFENKGFNGARMQEIADEAGINKSLLHYYFRSKEGLFDQIFLEAFKDFWPSIEWIAQNEEAGIRVWNEPCSAKYLACRIILGSQRLPFKKGRSPRLRPVWVT